MWFLGKKGCFCRKSFSRPAEVLYAGHPSSHGILEVDNIETEEYSR